jgi:hypothetical protein
MPCLRRSTLSAACEYLLRQQLWALWVSLGEMCLLYHASLGGRLQLRRSRARWSHLGLQRRRSIPVALRYGVLMPYLEGISCLTASNCAF